ncbi:hypothetical protein BDN70DRAFT_886117, partial [Pholiota conissans]
RLSLSSHLFFSPTRRCPTCYSSTSPRLAPPALCFNSHHLQKAVFALESRFHSHYKFKR